MALDVAAAALAAGDRELALAALLETWRMVRHPRIADTIDCVSDELTAARAPIKGKTVAARTQAWHEIERQRDPADLGRLLATPWPGTWKPALAMLEPLLQWPDDPRIAMAFARVLATTPYDTWKSAAFYRPLLRKLEALRDLRTLPVLRGQLAKHASRFYMGDVRPHELAAIATLEARFPRDIPPALDDEAERAIARIEDHFAERLAHAQATARGTRDHLAAIHADPDDLAARAVHADWLQERGDPRGELVALQLARLAAPPTEAALARERKLLDEHGVAWAGTLATWFEHDQLEFHGGFFAGGTLRWAHSDKVPELDDPAWRLVRALDGSDRLLRLLLARPELRSLREVRVDFDIAVAIAEGPSRPLTSLLWRTHWHLPAAPLETALAHCDTLPALRALGFETSHVPTHVAWIREAPVLERLTRLVLCDLVPEYLDEAAKRGGALREIELDRPRSKLRSEGWQILLQRDTAPGPFTRLVIRPRGGPHDPSELTAVLERIPADWLRELVITTPRKLAMKQAARAALAAAIARFDRLERCELPWPELVAPVAPAPQPSRSGPLVWLRFAGGSVFTVEKVPQVWRLLGELGLGYDSFEVGHKWRSLGQDPVERLQTWANNRRCHDIALYRDGVPGKAYLSKRAPGAVSLELPLGEPTELVDWIARFLELATFASGYGAVVGKELPWQKLDLGALGCTGVYPGWLLYFGPTLRLQLPVDEVAALGRRPELSGLFARAIANGGVLVGLCATPEELTEARLVAASQALAAILRRQLAAQLGFDFHERVHAIVATAAQALDLTLAPPDQQHLTVTWEANPTRLVVELEHVFVQPRLRATLYAHSASGGVVTRDVVASPASNRDEVDRALASVAADLRTHGRAFIADPVMNRNRR